MFIISLVIAFLLTISILIIAAIVPALAKRIDGHVFVFVLLVVFLCVSEALDQWDFCESAKTLKICPADRTEYRR